MNKPGREFPGVGTGAVIVKDNKLLLLKRAGSHGAGTWSVPGGWIDMWETPFESAEREVLEETGLKVKAIEALGWTNAFHQEEEVQAVTLWVHCALLDPDAEPTICEPEKCPEIEWVPFHELSERPLFTPLESYHSSITRWWFKRGFRLREDIGNEVVE